MTDKEIADYLTNFWDHSIDSTIKDIDGRVLSITKIDDEDNSQIQLNNEQRWCFIQDVSWFPSLEEATNAVCKKIGIAVYRDSIQYKKIIKPLPETFEELYESVTDIRSSILIS